MGTPSTTEMMKDKPITSEDVRVVLVIDDNLDAINLMRQNLEETGYQVITATSGDEGIAKAKRYQPFAITLDIMMPKKDGWQVMHELKSDPETREIPVVMVTIVDKKTLGFRLGAADYLIKPLDEEQVLTSLERLAQSTDGSESIYLLVIDDDPDIIDMVNQLLEDSNYTINSAANGEDALEKIINDPPDVIILDLMLPKLDGFGVIDHLHSDECLRQIPLIVLTAKLLSQEEQDRLLTSAVKIMQKQGLTNEELLSEISLAVTSR
jgi:CheY-like chemotaxis protein